MPSYASRNFKRKTIDAKRLARDYEDLLIIRGNKGRTALDHLTRSGVVLLAGAWETYIEDVILEGAVHLAVIDDPKNLPKEVKKSINLYIRNHKEDSKPLSIAGDGWKKVFLDEVVEPTLKGLNSPKIENVDSLAMKLLGVANLSSNITEKRFIDEFITYRGHIAHRVRVKGDAYLNLDTFLDYIYAFEVTVSEVDNYLADYIKKFKKSRPWNKYKNN
ncbi:hypothetical protein BK131_00660 [Paenibacillus amylolyticus]|uniref:RiboL-PSP-HEPN domain-containing protein n=2 Tax=Paenibacillus amylolyticus TaxID=1451 RepID=A0A1R1C352_PAEAM|nr:hypothetical protein BK131_00660 [Paenibacillus amylolyticus]